MSPHQKIIFQRLSEHKYYIDIAAELNISVDEVACKVKSVFCMAAFDTYRKTLIKTNVLGERFN